MNLTNLVSLFLDHYTIYYNFLKFGLETNWKKQIYFSGNLETKSHLRPIRSGTAQQAGAGAGLAWPSSGASAAAGARASECAGVASGARARGAWARGARARRPAHGGARHWPRRQHKRTVRVGYGRDAGPGGSASAQCGQQRAGRRERGWPRRGCERADAAAYFYRIQRFIFLNENGHKTCVTCG